mmetsp:Transcript_13069/g.38377  ORF Transcript_13069/g.38377 Transcript_13069/m.38377 type:complete len:282 (+) Transcript_13069:210-1055(+)
MVRACSGHEPERLLLGRRAWFGPRVLLAALHGCVSLLRAVPVSAFAGRVVAAAEELRRDGPCVRMRAVPLGARRWMKSGGQGPGLSVEVIVWLAPRGLVAAARAEECARGVTEESARVLPRVVRPPADARGRSGRARLGHAQVGHANLAVAEVGALQARGGDGGPGHGLRVRGGFGAHAEGQSRQARGGGASQGAVLNGFHAHPRSEDGAARGKRLVRHRNRTPGLRAWGWPHPTGAHVREGQRRGPRGESRLRLRLRVAPPANSSRLDPVHAAAPKRVHV